MQINKIVLSWAVCAANSHAQQSDRILCTSLESSASVSALWNWKQCKMALTDLLWQQNNNWNSLLIDFIYWKQYSIFYLPNLVLASKQWCTQPPQASCFYAKSKHCSCLCMRPQHGAFQRTVQPYEKNTSSRCPPCALLRTNKSETRWANWPCLFTRSTTLRQNVADNST